MQVKKWCVGFLDVAVTIFFHWFRKSAKNNESESDDEEDLDKKKFANQLLGLS